MYVHIGIPARERLDGGALRRLNITELYLLTMKPSFSVARVVALSLGWFQNLVTRVVNVFSSERLTTAKPKGQASSKRMISLVSALQLWALKPLQ